jgi:hypothetical protein
MTGDIDQADIRIRAFATPGLNCRLDGWIQFADFSSKVVVPPSGKAPTVFVERHRSVLDEARYRPPLCPR